MTFFILVPVSILMGFAGLWAFLWALRNDQFSDFDGAAWRIILDRQDSPGREAHGSYGGTGDERGEVWHDRPAE